MNIGEPMIEEDFIALASKVLRSRGTTQNAVRGERLFEDEVVRIRSNFEGLELEVERKARIDPENEHLRVANPVAMVLDGGTIIRHHGEHAFLVGHLKALAVSEPRAN